MDNVLSVLLTFKIYMSGSAHWSVNLLLEMSRLSIGDEAIAFATIRMASSDKRLLEMSKTVALVTLMHYTSC